MKDFFKKLQEWEIVCTDERIKLLESFVREIKDKTTKFNLISPNDVQNIWTRHVLDSLAAIPVIKKISINMCEYRNFNKSSTLVGVDSACVSCVGRTQHEDEGEGNISKIHVLDAGSGAGFPGIPIKIFLEDAHLEMWESNRKKHAFLTWIITLLKFKNTRAICKRINEVSQEKNKTGVAAAPRRRNIVLERAMGKLEDILPRCLNMTVESGCFLAWQSDTAILKTEKIKKILMENHAETENIHEYLLPHETKKRFIFVLKKGGNSLLL